MVVRENIFKHLERGKHPFQAALDGTQEIALSVLATTATIVAVFLPVAFVKGIVGQFFRQFGITISVAVVLSLFVAFTLDPMLSSRWYDPDIERKGRRSLLHRGLDLFNDWFERMADGYKRVIGWSLDHRFIVSSVAVLAFHRQPVRGSSLPPYVATSHFRYAAKATLTDGSSVEGDYVNLGSAVLRGLTPEGAVDISWHEIEHVRFTR